MENFIQILVGLAGLMLFGLGAMSMFAPKKMLKNFAVEPLGNPGLSTVRAVIGGLFMGGVAMLILGFLGGQTLWYLAVAILLGAVALGRVIGFLFDGFDKAVVPGLIVELVMVTIFVTAHMQLGIA